MTRKEIWRHFDFFLFGAVVIPLHFRHHHDPICHCRQCRIAGGKSGAAAAIFVAVGIAVLILLSVIDYRFWASITPDPYSFHSPFLAVILIVGQVSFGAQRWLDIGLQSFNRQRSPRS